MSDQEMAEEAPPVDPAAGFATALIIITTIMLLMATITTYKLLGDRYNEGMFHK